MKNPLVFPKPDLDQLVPIPTTGPYRFALLKGTRSVFMLSNQLYDFLTQARPIETNLSQQIASEVKRLKTLGFWNSHPSKTEMSAKQLIFSLHLVHGCNLSCTYCNVQQGTYGDKYSLMDVSTALCAIDYLKQQLKGRHPQLVFYGGEPLLNWPVLAAATKKMNSLFSKREIWIITNGTLITDERASFLADNDIFTIISIDGPREVHDKNRPMRSGASSYKKAVEGLNYLKKYKVRFRIRATWAPGNDDYDDVLSHLTDIAGSDRHVTVALQFDQISDTSIKVYNNILSEGYKKIDLSASFLPTSGHLFLDQLLRADWTPAPRCEAGHAGFSVTPNGEIYPCQVSTSLKKFKLGDIFQGIDEKGNKNLKHFLDNRSPVCEKCWAVTLCSGPCRYHVPIPENWPFCKTVKLHITEMLASIVKSSASALLSTYHLPEVTDDQFANIKRGCAMRDIMWQNNHHMKPIHLCPQKGSSL